MRKLLYAVAITALMSDAASAQMAFSPFNTPQKRALTPDEIARQQKIDEAYKSATKKIPDQQVNDPWATVRAPSAGAQQQSKK
jgi:hypothetical protein